jgi:hypothetical protein
MPKTCIVTYGRAALVDYLAAIEGCLMLLKVCSALR